MITTLKFYEKVKNMSEKEFGKFMREISDESRISAKGRKLTIYFKDIYDLTQTVPRICIDDFVYDVNIPFYDKLNWIYENKKEEVQKRYRNVFGTDFYEFEKALRNQNIHFERQGDEAAFMAEDMACYFGVKYDDEILDYFISIQKDEFTKSLAEFICDTIREIGIDRFTETQHLK